MNAFIIRLTVIFMDRNLWGIVIVYEGPPSLGRAVYLC